MLFVVDVGGTYALESRRSPAVANAPVVTAAHAPAVTIASAKPASVPRPAPAMPVVARHNAPVAPVVRVAKATRGERIARVDEPKAAVVVARVTPKPIAKPLAKPLPVAISKPRALVAMHPVAVHPVAVRRIVAKIAPAKIVPVEVRVASLDDVRHYVMRRIASKDRSYGVISSQAYVLSGGRVQVLMVVRDRTHRWFETDVVRRNGPRMALVGTGLHTLPNDSGELASSFGPAP